MSFDEWRAEYPAGGSSEPPKPNGKAKGKGKGKGGGSSDSSGATNTFAKSGRISLSSFALRRVPKRESPEPDTAPPQHASSEPACSSACASCGQESRKSAEADDCATCLA